MMRLKILASSVPVILAGFLARGELLPAHRPCIAMGNVATQLASLPWQAQTRVSFTDDPAQATVRVQIVDTPETADLTIVDDVDNPGDTGCGTTTETRLIGIVADVPGSDPVIYLSRDGDADYRIHVRSSQVSTHDAAALIVGANGVHRRVAATL